MMVGEVLVLAGEFERLRPTGNERPTIEAERRLRRIELARLQRAQARIYRVLGRLETTLRRAV